MTTVTDYPTGSLVIAGPWREARQLRSSPGVVVGPWGDNLLVWFWTLGAPAAGRTVQAMFARELTPLDDTLTTMHPDAFGDIERGFPDGWSVIGADGEALRAEIGRAAWERAAEQAISLTRRVLAHS
ncbi:DUF6409 family protein [Streptomyces sp. NPDC093109]|uniref:DUF6409 family protein n=1 Tax=Streptomyces sp. NPDC093109 TaxID=3154977 RepID=UPI00344F426B